MARLKVKGEEPALQGLGTVGRRWARVWDTGGQARVLASLLRDDVPE